MSRPNVWSLDQLAELRDLVAAGQSARQVSEQLGRNQQAVLAAVRRHGLGPWQHVKARPPVPIIPADFAERWAEMDQKSLAHHYARGEQTIRDIVRALGLKRPSGVPIKPREPIKRVRPSAPQRPRQIMAVLPPPVERPRDEAGRAILAAKFLQGISSVFRCNETGRQDPQGKFWRRGAAVLTDRELIDRAERNGFDPNAWRRCA